MEYSFIEGLGLSVIADIDFDLLIFAFVLDGEIEPLHVPTRVGVWPQKDVVLILADLNDQIEVSTLKLTIEDKVASGEVRIHSIKISTFSGGLVFEGELLLDEIGDVLSGDSKLEDVLMGNVFVKHQGVCVAWS